jgi:hypothetical protein
MRLFRCRRTAPKSAVHAKLCPSLSGGTTRCLCACPMCYDPHVPGCVCDACPCREER